MSTSKIVYQAAQGLLARREHSKLELKQKLSRKEYELDIIVNIIDLLAQQGFQCDERYAESCFRSRVKKGYGPNYICQYLSQKGIEETIINKVYSELDVNWLECVECVWKKKFIGSAQDIKNITKQKQFLYYRGFSSEVINQLFKKSN